MSEQVNANKLSKEWCPVLLEEVGRIETGTTPSKGNSEYYGNEIPFFKPSDLEQGIDTNFSSDGLSKLGFEKARKLPKDSVLVTCIGATIGKTGLIRVDGACNQQINSITPNAFHDSKFVFFQIISNKFQRQIKDNSSSTTLPILNKSKFSKLKFITTGLNNQIAIVSKIEKLFSELDKGIENLHLAQQQLQTYRQAVLKWAFEGRLTNEGGGVSEFVTSWKRVKLGLICEINRGKSKHRPRNEPLLYGGKYPFIQTGDIRNAQGGTISEFSQTYSEQGLQQSKLWPKGTLCITIAANIGETAMLGFDACFPDSVVGLLPNGNLLLVKFLNYFFISFKQNLERLAPATAQKNINVEILENVEIPVCSLEEQAMVVQEIESRLSVADKLKESTTQSLQQAEALRQSILKQAFDGKLV